MTNNDDIMSKLHGGQGESIFVPSEVRRRPLCSNFGSPRRTSLGVDNQPFTEETVGALQELGEILKGIRKRLILEGKIK